MTKLLFVLLLFLLIDICYASSSDSQDVIVFLFIALLIGALITYILARFAKSLPYTVVVFAIGALISASFSPVNDHNVLKISLTMWDNIQPDLILFIFLPALLFGEAMSLTFHHIRGAFTSAALLAGPGALFGAMLLGVLAKYTLPYGWGWSLCFTFGSILCATDPVAVVALLKSGGASNKLTYLIIGEALMNDGTALVLYNLLFNLIKSPSVTFTPMDVFLYFLKVIFISPLLGIAMGFVSLFLLSLANRRMKEEDTTMQMAITICCAYLSFFVAENVIEVSGVICCCSAAVVLSQYANPLILRPGTIESIWAAAEWIGNTVIFMLAGLIIGSRTMQYLQAIDILYILLIYLFMLLVRAVMMFLFYPLLSNIGKKVNPRECVFITWGGLRGAVSMALALSLVQSTSEKKTNISEDDSHRVFFLVGGVAALTLLINATTSGTLLEKLNLLDSASTDEVKIMYNYVKKRIRLKAWHLVDYVQKTKPTFFNPLIVVKYCSILHDSTQSPTGSSQSGSHVTGVNDPMSPPKPLEAADLDDEATLQKNTLGNQFLSASIELTNPETPTMERNTSPIDPSYSSQDVSSQATTNTPKKSVTICLPNEETKKAPSTLPQDNHEDQIQDTESQRDEEETKEPGADPATQEVIRQLRKGVGYGYSGRPSSHEEDEDDGFANEIEIRTLESSAHLDHELRLTPPRKLIGSPAASFKRQNLIQELLVHIRRAFLEVVRVNYWKQINSGKLPRRSSAALVLLNSIDVALETIDTPGLQDWQEILRTHKNMFEGISSQIEDDEDIEAQLSRQAEEDEDALSNNDNPFDQLPALNRSNSINTRSNEIARGISGFFQFSQAGPTSSGGGRHRPLNEGRGRTRSSAAMFIESTYNGQIAKSLRDYRQAQLVYLLLAFIDAHEYAQRKIPFYLGDTESIDTPEEQMVVNESKKLVIKARAKLSAIDKSIISLQVSKQTARWILHMQEDQIEEFLKEGVITEKDAEILFHEVEHDFLKIGKEDWFNMILAKSFHRIDRSCLKRYK